MFHTRTLAIVGPVSIAILLATVHARATPIAPVTLGDWVIAGEDVPALTPPSPFAVAPFLLSLNGVPSGDTRLLVVSHRAPAPQQGFPQNFGLYASGYLRLKAGSDPMPPLPFGQSAVLGPAFIGSLVPGEKPAFYLNPQITSVNVRTGAGDGFPEALTIEVAAAAIPGSNKTNGVINASWTLKLHEPAVHATLLDITSSFTFVRDFYTSVSHRSTGEAFQLFRISSMVIDQARHDVNQLAFTGATGPVNIDLVTAAPGILLPNVLTALRPDAPVLQVNHTDDEGLPNGNTPSFTFAVHASAGPASGALFARAFITPSNNLNDDNFAAWIAQTPLEFIPASTAGEIRWTVSASTDPPLSGPGLALNDLVIDFGPPYGISVWQNNSGWVPLHPVSAQSIIRADLDKNGQDDLVIDFGTLYGISVWMNNSGWVPLHPLSAQSITRADLDKNGHDDLVIDFGPQHGIWLRMNNSSWVQLHTVGAKSIARADVDHNGHDDLVIDFGPQYGIIVWMNNTSWVPLNPVSAQSITRADLDKNGHDDLVIDFGPQYGIWLRMNNKSWVQLHTVGAKSITRADVDHNGQDDLVIDFGPHYGISAWMNNSGWVPLHPVSAQSITRADLDKNGHDDLVIDFGPQYEIWLRMNNSTWVPLHGIATRHVIAAEIDGQ